MPVKPPQAKPARLTLLPEDIASASRIAAGIEADKLRDAVARLGAGVLARQRRRGLGGTA